MTTIEKVVLGIIFVLLIAMSISGWHAYDLLINAEVFK